MSCGCPLWVADFVQTSCTYKASSLLIGHLVMYLTWLVEQHPGQLLWFKQTLIILLAFITLYYYILLRNKFFFRLYRI